MKELIIAAGIACIAYAYWKKRRAKYFRDILEREELESDAWDDKAEYSKADYKDVERLKLQYEEMEKELAYLKESEKTTLERLESIERFFDEFTGNGRKGKRKMSTDSQKIKDMNGGDYDFENKSLDELVSETGLKKGELLLLKRLSKK